MIVESVFANLSNHSTREEPTVRETSNPVFRSLPKKQGGYAQFGAGAGGYGAQAVHADPYMTQYPDQRQAGVSRPLTIDDVVTKTGITLAVLAAVAVVAYFFVAQNLALAMPVMTVGLIGGIVLILIAIFGRKQDSPAIVLSYAAFEGLVLGTFSFIVANFMVSGISAGALISQAIVGTFGVFFGMLVVYKTGAIRVTPKFTRFLVAAGFGAVVLMLVNLVIGLFTHSAGPLRNGGPMAILFSLLMIGLAAFFFLSDFDQADQAIRAGAPEKAAWGIALGLTVTLVWLYLEILRLLSYFNNN
ncbi:MAG: Bax inhibitor-1/YccA family protein [Mycobacterium sp.]